jgi:hypothetical protein
MDECIAQSLFSFQYPFLFFGKYAAGPLLCI